RTAELQRRLADRAEKLMDQLEQLGQKLAEKDPGLAEMLERAAKIGREEIVPASMRGAAELLQDDFDKPQPAKRPKAQGGAPDVRPAGKTQGKIVETLEKMLDALDQTRADEVERLIVRQKKEEKNLDDLAARLAKVQEQIEAARKIADPKERDAVLKKLGEELRELQKQADQNARDLGHARAKDAARDVREAAKKLERVVRQLERGEDTEEDLRQARADIDEAKDKLKDARDAAEEELSREQIAKIVDRLKGLKDHQDVAAAEAERLRKDFLQNKKWLYPKILSLVDLVQTQKGLAGETASLRDKLKGAMVFHTVLGRAHKDMADAGAKLGDWRGKGDPPQER